VNVAPGRPGELPRYAELHCLTAFSFLRGASEPAELVERAVTLGYEALAITDECSLAGVVRAHKQLREMREAAHHALKEAAKEAGLADDYIENIEPPQLMKLLIGSEFLVRDDAEQPRFKLVLIAQNLNGYGNLSQFITRLRRASPVKGEYTLRWRQIAPEQLTDCLALLVLPRDASDAELLTRVPRPHLETRPRLTRRDTQDHFLAPVGFRRVEPERREPLAPPVRRLDA